MNVDTQEELKSTETRSKYKEKGGECLYCWDVSDVVVRKKKQTNTMQKKNKQT